MSIRNRLKHRHTPKYTSIRRNTILLKPLVYVLRGGSLRPDVWGRIGILEWQFLLASREWPLAEGPGAEQPSGE